MGKLLNSGDSKVRIIALLVGGIGGVSVDIDHLLSTITGGKVEWAFLHTNVFIIGCALTLLGGLLGTLVLRWKR